MYQKEPLEWPYPVSYGKENQIAADVLVLGGGIAGCWAAISAARKGVKVILVEKGATIRSGAGGKGCDHWLNTPNPLSDVTAEEATNMQIESDGGYANGLSAYIAARESYDTLLEMEQMGGKIRDTDDEFKNAPFRDEKTKFCFAYDYVNRYQFRVWGTTFKPALYNECKRLGVEIYDRVQVTSLLTEGGKQGARVIGATGLNNRTGEFYIFKAKAAVNCLSRHQRNWVFSTETVGIPTFRPTSIVGNGHAMCWRAGAEFTMMEKSVRNPTGSGWTYPAFGTGNPFSTWLPCSMVDADGKEVPWEDANGKILSNIEERTRPAQGQKFLGERQTDPRWRAPRLISDLPERIVKGEFKLPLYADLPSMPDYERKAIFGLMCGEEGRTKIPIVRTYTESGFDPKIDLLQSYIILRGSPQGDRKPGVGLSVAETASKAMLALPQQRAGGESGSAGGLVVDWNLMTTLPGMFAAGDALFAGNYHSHAAATGRYAGRKAADYALEVAEPVVDQKQVRANKVRVYAPIGRRDGLDWKELTFAGCRVMQNYCGELKNEELLEVGLIWLKDLRENEVSKLYADNPHKLGRALDVMDILTCDEIIIQTSLARKASSKFLSFMRLDYTEVDPAEWHKWITINLEGEKVKVGELPIDFWGPLKENYEAHNKGYVGLVKE